MRPIILEGPDGSGKSTLASKLREALGRPWEYHTGGPPADKAALIDKLVAMQNQPPGTIFDRAPQISDPIYAEISSRPLYLTRKQLAESLLKLKPVVVYCRLRYVREMWDSISRRPKPHKALEHLQRVLGNFEEVVELYDDYFYQPPAGLKVLRYDWTRDNFEDLVEELKRCAV